MKSSQTSIFVLFWLKTRHQELQKKLFLLQQKLNLVNRDNDNRAKANRQKKL